MSKVITFSRYFQKSHPQCGQPTFFVEKIFNEINTHQGKSIDVYELDKSLNFTLLTEFGAKVGRKKHTIRSGNRFKAGDFFSPRVWSGKPYSSPQIVLCDDVEIENVWDIVFVQKDKFLSVNGVSYEKSTYENMIKVLAENDGLSVNDFKSWFTKPFTGEVICWSSDVSY